MSNFAKNEVEVNLYFNNFSIAFKGTPLSVTSNLLSTTNQDNNEFLPSSFPMNPSSSDLDSSPIVKQEYDTFNMSSDPNVFFGYVSKEDAKPINRSSNPDALYLKYGLAGSSEDIATQATWERILGVSRGLINHRSTKEVNKGGKVDPNQIVYASYRAPINAIYFSNEETGELIPQTMVR